MPARSSLLSLAAVGLVVAAQGPLTSSLISDPFDPIYVSTQFTTIVSTVIVTLPSRSLFFPHLFNRIYSPYLLPSGPPPPTTVTLSPSSAFTTTLVFSSLPPFTTTTTIVSNVLPSSSQSTVIQGSPMQSTAFPHPTPISPTIPMCAPF